MHLMRFYWPTHSPRARASLNLPKPDKRVSLNDMTRHEPKFKRMGSWGSSLCGGFRKLMIEITLELDVEAS
jgi:hypothetical protein